MRDGDTGQDKGKSCSTDLVDGFTTRERIADLDSLVVLSTRSLDLHEDG